MRELADRFDLLGSGRGLQRISIHAVYARTSAAAVTALLTERDELRERLDELEDAARSMVHVSSAVNGNENPRIHAARKGLVRALAEGEER